MQSRTYEEYPLWAVAVSSAFAVTVYVLGAFILSGFGKLAVISYILYCLWIEYRVLRKGCVDCFYYDRLCCFGKGRICSMLFKKGEPKRFSEKQITLKHIIPDFMVGLIPLAGGAILLVRDFSCIIASAMVALAVLSFAGNAVIRGKLACRYCRQRELGCPAEKLFNKEGKR
jgi:hypothetical protein